MPVRRPTFRAFTLVELLVVIGIIGLLIAILLPALGAARREGARVKCLSNIRNMALAQQMYCNENHGWLVTGGLGHGSEASHEEITWFNTLNRYYNNKLVARCPSDDSLTWETPIIGTDANGKPESHYRRTSYAINGFLDHNFIPWGPGFSDVPITGLYKKIESIRRSSDVVQFLEIAYDGIYSAADHTHPNLFADSDTPSAAIPKIIRYGTDGKSGQMQTNAHGNPRLKVGWDNVANYAFIDGHADSLRLRDVFTDRYVNKFDPASPQPRP